MSQVTWNDRIGILVAALGRTPEAKRGDLRVVQQVGYWIIVRFTVRSYCIVVAPDHADLTLVNISTLADHSALGQSVSGTIILSGGPPSTELRQKGRTVLPSDIAVVALWGASNKLLHRSNDELLLRLCKLAINAIDGVDRITVDGIESRQVKTTAPPHAASTTKEKKPIPVPTERPRSARRRKGLKLDAYELQQFLGRGASAEVWKARVIENTHVQDLEVNDAVAIKLYSGLFSDWTQPIRIHREFQVASSIDHANVGRVFDLVLSPNRPLHNFMVMEYVPGLTLKAHIGRRGKIDPQDTLEIGKQLFSAIAEIHSHGVLHRDVKAANVMIHSEESGAPRIKLVDLGIVAVASEPSLTATSVFLGSKHSAPIEQLSGETIDERADVYGAGAVLFNCLTGRPLYDGAGTEVAIARRMEKHPERIDDRAGSDLFNALGALVNECIQFERDNRPNSAEDCLARLVGMA